MLGVTHALDVATATWFYVLESKPDVLQPARELDFSFEHTALDALTLAVIRAVLFPLLVLVAVHARPNAAFEQERPSTASGPPPEGGYIRLNDATQEESGGNLSTKRIVASRGARSPGWAIAAIFIISTACQVFTGIKVKSTSLECQSDSSTIIGRRSMVTNGGVTAGCRWYCFACRSSGPTLQPF